jgi:hypothetical protein
MKSVFHVCEAFFFMAEGEDTRHRELLSPWGTEFRSTESARDGKSRACFGTCVSMSRTASVWQPLTEKRNPTLFFFAFRRIPEESRALSLKIQAF